MSAEWITFERLVFLPSSLFVMSTQIIPFFNVMFFQRHIFLLLKIHGNNVVNEDNISLVSFRSRVYKTSMEILWKIYFACKWKKTFSSEWKVPSIPEWFEKWKRKVSSEQIWKTKQAKISFEYFFSSSPDAYQLQSDAFVCINFPVLIRSNEVMQL